MPASVVSPPDLPALATNLAALAAVAAAVAGGIWHGIKEIRKGGAPTKTEVVSGLIMDGVSVRNLIDSNRKLCEINSDIKDVLCRIEADLERHIEALKDQREMTRSQVEEQHRLRAATVDLVEMMRRRF